MADVEQMEKIVPLITRKITFGQDVCELVFGVDVFDLNLWIQIDSVKLPIKNNSVSPGNMSHCRTPALDDHFNHCFVILKNVEHRTTSRRLRVRRSITNITQFKIVVLNWSLNVAVGLFS